MSQELETGTAIAVRPSSFPVAHPDKRIPKTPVVKKGNGGRFKNARLRERLQRERLRGSLVFGVGASSSDSPKRKTFQTRFESRPVTFKIAKCASIGSHTVAPVTKMFSPPTTTTTTHDTKKSANLIGVSPGNRSEKTRIHGSPTLVPPPSVPPSATRTVASGNVSGEPSGTDSRKNEATTSFVVRNVNKILPSHPQSDSEEDDEDNDVASLLCLVPLAIQQPSDNQNDDPITTHWPCLVIRGLQETILWHKRLYPNQDKLRKRLSKRFMKLTQADNEEEEANRILVLPLGDEMGCCPAKVCKKPLYDVIDNDDSSACSDRYWTTLEKKKGPVIEGGNKVVRLLENFDAVDSIVRESKRQIPEVGTELENALREMERLLYLDDNDQDSDAENHNSPFVSSLRAVSEDEETNKILQPIRFPTHSFRIEKPRRSRKNRSTPNASQTNTPSIQFPQSSQKPTRVAPSISPEKSCDNPDGSATKFITAGTNGGNPTEEIPNMDEGAVAGRNQSSPCDKPLNPTKTKRSNAQSPKRSHDNLLPSMGETKSMAATKKRAANVGKERKKPSATKHPKKARTSSATTPSKKTPSRQKKPTVIDSSDRISISSWKDIKPLLMQMGHVFYDEEIEAGRLVQYFCRPNGDPRVNPHSSEGEDYFTSLKDYRAHMCVHGVEYIGTNTSTSHAATSSLPKDDDLELVAYWVRFHIFSQRVTGERKSEKIPDLELSGNKGKYIKLLQKIGYKFRYGLNEGYAVPGAKSKLVLPEDELWKHLGKHGLSPACKFDQFESVDEQMALEIQIIRKYHGNHGDKVFRPIEKVDPIMTDENREIETENKEYTPAASKEALEECTRGPDSTDEPNRLDVMSPRKLMTDETEAEQNVDSDAFPTLTQPSEATDGANFDQRYDCGPPAAKSGNPKNGDDFANHKAQKDKNVNTSEVSDGTSVGAAYTRKQLTPPEVTIAEVDLPGSKNEEKLRSCIQYIRDRSEIVTNGNLSSSIARIRSFVDTVIESKGEKGDGKGSNKYPILYICGNPGTGKTMSTKKICEEAIAAKTKSNDKTPRMCYISCPSFQEFKYEEGMKKLMERMQIKQNQLKRSRNDDLNSATILILDEVDQLLEGTGAKRILKQLSSWAKDENYTLSIIGISNAVFNTKTESLMEYGMGGVSNKLVFETYRKEDLVRLSQSKIGFSVVDKKAHEFIAAKVANSSGDARQYLALVEKAIIFCRRKLSLEKRDSIHTKPIVMIRDAMLAIRETNQKCKDTIQNLTSFEKMALCAGVHLARKLGGKSVRMQKLRELTIHSFGIDSDLSLEDFKGVIERLQDNGLLKLHESFTNTRMSNLLNYPLRFDLQLEDVDSALEDTLMKEDFYKRMVERLKTISV